MNNPVVISGGGIIGCYIHARLKQAGVDSIIIERNKKLKANLENIRTISLNPNTLKLLSDIGMNLELANVNLIKVADGNGSGKIEFSAKDIGEESLAYVIMFNDLLIKMQQLAESSIHFENEISSIEAFEDLSKITLADKTLLDTPLLIGSDGRNSPVARLSNFISRKEDYDQTAFTFLVEDKSDKDTSTAHQLFTDKGIFALMPVNSSNKNIFSVVWSVSNKILDSSPQNFVSSNIRLIESMLDSKFIIKSEIVSFPLSSHHLKSYMKEGVVVVGDAAHSLHPLAGQGINLGFSDADILCEELISAYKKGYSINSYRVLKSYELRRKSMNEIMLKAMDGFVSLFGSSNIYIRILRNFGLTFFNKTLFIKAFFINHASGNHKL